MNNKKQNINSPRLVNSALPTNVNFIDIGKIVGIKNNIDSLFEIE